MLYRYWRHGATRHVHPMTVVEDGPDWLVLWLAPGTPVVRGLLADGSDFRTLPVAERFLVERTAKIGPWRGTGVLKLVPRATAAYAVWLFWHPDGTFRGWYGNLEQPQTLWTRADGWRVVDTADHVLDVWCPPDRVPVWKDEDEFAVTTGLTGYWDDVGADKIRAEGERVRAAARRGDPPFDGRWTDFRADPALPFPGLPDDWAAVDPAQR